MSVIRVIICRLVGHTMVYFGGGVWRCWRCHGRAPSSWDHDGGPLMQMFRPESREEA